MTDFIEGEARTQATLLGSVHLEYCFASDSYRKCHPHYSKNKESKRLRFWHPKLHLRLYSNIATIQW